MDMKRNPIQISQVEIVPFPAKSGHVGFASVKIDNNFLLSDLALFTRLDGTLRIGYPKKHLANGTEVTIFKPLSREIDLAIESAITQAYFALMNGDGMRKEPRNGSELVRPN